MVTVSESTRENMRYIGFTDKKAIDIVNPGLDPEKYAPQKKTQDPSILYLGRLKKYKTIDVVIESLPEILKQFPKTHFTIAGFGEYKTQLQKTALKLGVSEFVTFTGRIPEKKKLSLLAESWVLVNPSFMEGWGITAIEASASGTAVVASNVPGLRDSVQHEKTGLLVRYGSVEEFTESILFFLKNKKERLQCEKNSLLWAKRFSWEKSADKMLQVLQSII
jgi:glycosyltransferase involved in cell wall biosynthesis